MDLKLILFCHKCTIFKLFMGEELMSRLYIYKKHILNEICLKFQQYALNFLS